MRGWMIVSAAVTALALTVVAVATAPDATRITASFPVSGSVGQTLVSRQLTVNATGVRLAKQLDTVYADAGNTTSDGIWLIVDADVTPGLDLIGLAYATASIGGVEYRASGILPAPSLAIVPFGPGVTYHGTLVFEVPTSAIESAAAARTTVAFNFALEPKLDSVPVVDVDLRGVSVDAVASIDAPYVVATK